MRQAGKLPSEDQARRFVDYLLTKKIHARAEAVNGEFLIWINEEDHFPEAQRELKEFRDQPQHERYLAAGKQAQSIRSEQVKRMEEARKRVTNMQSQWNRPATQRQPLTLALILICVVVAIFSSFGDFDAAVTQLFTFVDPVTYLKADGIDQIESAPASSEALQIKLLSIRQGQVWRLVTPAFLHFGIPHLVFNMIMLYQLGAILETRLSTLRFGLVVFMITILSTGPTALMPYALTFPFTQSSSPFVAGMSGVIYGLAGYLWAKTMLDPMLGIMLNPRFIMILLAWLVLGISGILDRVFGIHISNWGHLLGLIVGFALPYVVAAVGKKS